MHIEYAISEQDYASAQKLAMKQMKPLQQRLTLQWLPAFGLFLLGFVLYTGFKQGFSANLVPGVFIPFLFLSLRFTAKKAIRNSYAKATNMHGSLVLDIDDDGIRFQGPTYDSQVSWAHFGRFFEDNESFLIVHNSSIFNIVPKRFLSAEQITELRDIFSRHIVIKN